jgi:hypothetical protein
MESLSSIKLFTERLSESQEYLKICQKIFVGEILIGRERLRRPPGICSASSQKLPGLMVLKDLLYSSFSLQTPAFTEFSNIIKLKNENCFSNIQQRPDASLRHDKFMSASLCPQDIKTRRT